MGWGRGRGGQKRGRKKKEIDGGSSDLSSESIKSGSGEESTIRPEEKEGGGGGFFACYLLTSLSPRHKGQTYIGFTVNPRRRIRQHNGEISSGAFRTKKKRPWEMVLCIYGFPTNISALQFEWAWQHPKESINVREAAATLKSVSGLANKIKLAYKMLNLPAWNSLNMTVNIFSTKYTIHSAGLDLPKHMKSQIGSMDELPCYTNDYNHLELHGEDDELFGRNETLISEDDDGEDKDNSPLKTLSSSGEKVWLRDEMFFELSDDDDDKQHMQSPICSMDKFPGYTTDVTTTHENGGDHDELNGQDEELSAKNDNDGDKDSSPLKTSSSSFCGDEKVWLTEETFLELSDDDDDRHCLDRSHKVDVIDLLSPSPIHGDETCSKKKKKRRIMMDGYPHDIIDLTKSPVFV